MYRVCNDSQHKPIIRSNYFLRALSPSMFRFVFQIPTQCYEMNIIFLLILLQNVSLMLLLLYTVFFLLHGMKYVGMFPFQTSVVRFHLSLTPWCTIFFNKLIVTQPVKQ